MLNALFRAQSIFPTRAIVILLAGLLCGFSSASTAASSSETNGWHDQGSPEEAKQPFELSGILQLGGKSQASIHPKSGEGRAVWLAPGQTRGNLSLIEINSQKSQVKIRYAGEVHVLRLQTASDLAIPLYLKPNVVEKDGRLMRKMRIPAGRGRSNSSSTVLMPVPEDQTRSAASGTASTAAETSIANSNGSTNSEAQNQASSSGGSETLTIEELRDFQIPARRASIRAKAHKLGEAP